MDAYGTLAERYIESWNETDPGRRRALIDRLYAPDGGYTDPNVALRGRDEIEGFVADTQRRFPGYVFTVGGKVDGHHGQARFNWHATPPGGTKPAYVGFDVIVTDDGQVREVYGFIDRVPAA
jgi:hypothetical protein